jgi:hypothetical protein
VTATPTEAFVAARTSHLPSGVFVTGLMATALFSWSLVAMMHRATVLRIINDRLEAVIAERRRAERALRVEERTTQETGRGRPSSSAATGSTSRPFRCSWRTRTRRAR